MSGRGGRPASRARLAAVVAAAVAAAPALPAPPEPEPAAGVEGPASPPPPAARPTATVVGLLGFAAASSDQVDGRRGGLLALEGLGWFGLRRASVGLLAGTTAAGHTTRYWGALLAGAGAAPSPALRLDLHGELGAVRFVRVEPGGGFVLGRSTSGGQATLPYAGARLSLLGRSGGYAAGLSLVARRTLGSATSRFTVRTCDIVFGGCSETVTPIRYGGFEAGISLLLGKAAGGPPPAEP